MRFPRPEYEIRVAVYNSADELWKRFLDITPEEIMNTVCRNLDGAFGFSRQVILEYQKNVIDAIGKRGALIFTGATSSVRGNIVTSAFATSKHGLRALSQSLSKEFGQQNIHVSENSIVMC